MSCDFVVLMGVRRKTSFCFASLLRKLATSGYCEFSVGKLVREWHSHSRGSAFAPASSLRLRLRSGGRFAPCVSLTHFTSLPQVYNSVFHHQVFPVLQPYQCGVPFSIQILLGHLHQLFQLQNPACTAQGQQCHLKQ